MVKSYFKNLFTFLNFNQFLKRSYIFIVLILIYIPLIVIIFLSFTQPSSRGNVVLTFEHNWNGGQNYHSLFFDPVYSGDFWASFGNSIIIGLIITPICLIIGTITVLGIWRAKQVTKHTVINTSKISIINPDVITGIALSTLFIIAFLPVGLNLGWFTIILSHISFTVPYVIIALYPRISKLNYNLILASQDLNHNKIQTFFKVVVPFLTPALIGASLIAFVTSFDDFIITNLVRGRVNTLSTELYTMRKGIKSWAITFGALMIFMTLIIVVSIILFKWLKNRKSSIVGLNNFFSRLRQTDYRLKNKQKIGDKNAEFFDQISHAE